MSHHKLRTEKECLNCGAYVEERFCPKCGQENSINRPKFHYLFTHFFEDLTHYDGKFWKTLKYLFTKPGFVVNEYLAGKRKSHVNPIRLYIFVSFITFFLPVVFNIINKQTKSQHIVTIDAGREDPEFSGIEYAGHDSIMSTKQLDSIYHSLPDSEKDNFQYKIQRSVLVGLEANGKTTKSSQRTYSAFVYHDIKSIEELDSIRNTRKNAGIWDWFSYKFLRKQISLNKEGRSSERFYENFQHNLPKILFIYLPIFAFMLWLFHGKKKWFYYDHGIFTLYYFSILLLTITLLITIDWIFGLFGEIHFLKTAMVFLSIGAFVYSLFYFFRAHRKVYKESKIISRMKALSIFFINFFVINILLIIYTVFIYMNL